MDFEITKREVIVSISILAIMLIFGFIISDKIDDYCQDQNAKYNKAFKISNDKDLFDYAMKTNVGNSFVEGELESVDKVNINDIPGDYMIIEKVKEKYTMHTRTVTTTVNGKTRTRVETYWTWDRVGTETFKSKEINFLGNKFKSSKFNLPDTEYLKTIEESSHIRYKYYVLDPKFKATIFANLKENTITGDNAKVFKDMNINETLEHVITESPVVGFWIIWIFISAGVIFGFVYLENRWLNSN